MHHSDANNMTSNPYYKCHFQIDAITNSWLKNAKTSLTAKMVDYIFRTAQFTYVGYLIISSVMDSKSKQNQAEETI